MTKRAGPGSGSGSVPKCHGSGASYIIEHPDRPENAVMCMPHYQPEHFEQVGNPQVSEHPSRTTEQSTVLYIEKTIIVTIIIHE
jgi:hypothetical protein